MKAITLALLLSVLIAACRQPVPGAVFHRTTFEALDRAGRAIQAATPREVGPEWQSLLDTMLTELSKTKNLVSSEREAEVLTAYEEAFQAYADGYQLWRHKMQDAAYSHLAGRVAYYGSDPELSAIVQRYSLPVVPGQGEERTLQADSPQLVWSQAAARLDRAESLLAKASDSK